MKYKIKGIFLRKPGAGAEGRRGGRVHEIGDLLHGVHGREGTWHGRRGPPWCAAAIEASLEKIRTS